MTASTTIKFICKNCVAWQPIDLKGPHTIGEPKRGLCIMLPPSVALIIKNGQEVGQKNMRPCTLETEFCLSFVPKESTIDATNEAT